MMPLIAQPFTRVTALVSLLLMAVGAHGQMTGLNPTALEIAQLPKFCWAQMKVPNADGPEFRIASCGPAMNHYCPGLIELIRAKRTADARKKAQLLGSVAANVRYTESGMQNFPNCPIRAHVAATKAEVERLMTIYRVKR